MHPHSDRRSPNVHPVITEHLFVENAKRVFLRFFPSMSLVLGSTRKLRHARIHRLFKANPFKVSFGVVFPRVLSAFSCDDLEEPAAGKQFLLGRLEKVNPPFAVR
jgi:hypothetical protein